MSLMSMSPPRTHPLRRVALGSTLVLALLASGCDILFVLVTAPFFPGLPQPPPPDLTCPLDVAAPGELPPIPETFTPEPPVARGSCEPTSKTLHRLNRVELDNSWRDLTGLDLQLARGAFPQDDFGGGFDNNADVLAMSPLLVEKLEGAAAEVIRAAMQRPGEVSEIHTFEAELGIGDSGQDLTAGERLLFRGTRVDVQAILPNAAGVYAIRARAGTNADDAVLEIDIDGERRFASRITGTREDKQLVEFRASLDKGPVHSIVARFPPAEDGRNGDAILGVDFFEVEGPLVVTELGPPPPSRQRIVACDLDAAPQAATCVRDTLAAFARRAWRRPVADEEVDRLVSFVGSERRAGDTLEDALRTALTAVLLSPHFLYRVELDPLVDDVNGGVIDDSAHPLSDHELATRLSYFVWSSTPDDRLLDLADRGALQDPNVLETETRRMLDDPRSQALVTSFAGQWLFTRAVSSASPDPLRFPEFDEELRAAMQCETELTFDRLLRDPDASALDLVTSDETFVNARLARHYGLEAPDTDVGNGWGLVSTQGTGRSGILGHASLLTVTSQPTRTSPTRRGKFVLENLLCLVPDPPPPGVEGLVEPEQGEEEESVRERLEQHRADPSCASCHSVIDPIGFGLEHFDAIGRYRGSDAGFAIDDSALYMDTDAFTGASELGALIRDDPQLPFCMAQKTMTYALGQSVLDDACLVEDVNAKFAEGGYKMSDLIVETVRSPAFRMRRGAP
jgi:hypothetical protein